MSQPPINPLKNMKIDYWYKALTVVGAALFVFNGTSFFDRYPVVPLGFLSSGIFFIGLGEWINHPLIVRFIGPGVWTRGYSRVKIFERWKAIDTRDKREKFTALVPAIMEAIRINDFRLYREISDGKSITYMIAGLNKEYGDVVESGLLFADPAVVDRETDELIEKAIAFKLAYRQQYQQKAGWNYEPSFC